VFDVFGIDTGFVCLKCHQQSAEYYTGRTHLHSSMTIVFVIVPSVLWCCWLGGKKGIRPVKNWVVGAGMVICLVRCRFACGPADATATHCLLLQ